MLEVGKKTKHKEKGAFPKLKVTQRSVLKAESVALYNYSAVPIPVLYEVYRYLWNSLWSLIHLMDILLFSFPRWQEILLSNYILDCFSSYNT